MEQINYVQCSQPMKCNGCKHEFESFDGEYYCDFNNTGGSETNHFVISCGYKCPKCGSKDTEFRIESTITYKHYEEPEEKDVEFVATTKQEITEETTYLVPESLLQYIDSLQEQLEGLKKLCRLSGVPEIFIENPTKVFCKPTEDDIKWAKEIVKKVKARKNESS